MSTIHLFIYSVIKKLYLMYSVPNTMLSIIYNKAQTFLNILLTKHTHTQFGPLLRHGIFFSPHTGINLNAVHTLGSVGYSFNVFSCHELIWREMVVRCYTI